MEVRDDVLDVIVIGGGQAGLAVGYHLRRTGLSFLILDAEEGPGGAWRKRWESLRLFSPAPYSSLPGRLMEGGRDYYPTRDEVIDYLARYEAHYDLPVERPVWVEAVRREEAGFVLETSKDIRRARAVVSATGTHYAPHVPQYPGQGQFAGRQLHSAEYRSPLWFAGERILVVGGGNSGAQIMAELTPLAEATWVTRREPEFLPKEIDGRDLFERATAYYRARKEGREPSPRLSLGDIVQVPPVREARERGDLERRPMFERFTRRGIVWPDGTEEPVDTVIWATGFNPVLEHLKPLGVVGERGRVATDGPRALDVENLWLVGYGNWTGFASATLIGVGRSARRAVEEIEAALSAAVVWEQKP